jgi:hypothetical protein
VLFIHKTFISNSLADRDCFSTKELVFQMEKWTLDDEEYEKPYFQMYNFEVQSKKKRI